MKMIRTINVRNKIKFFFLIALLYFQIGWYCWYMQSRKQLILVNSNRVSSFNSINTVSNTNNARLAADKTSAVHHPMQQNSSSSFRTKSAVQKLTAASISLTNERYELMERYLHTPLNVETSASHFKRILLWHEAYYGKENFDIGYRRDAFRQLGCPIWQCETSDNRTDVQNYDAILFHYRSWNQNDLPKHRSTQQRYVFWTRESPMWRIYGDDPNPMANFFNWTMTYRWDSDMVMPYGYIAPTGNVPFYPSQDQMRELLSNQKINYATGKRKMAAWMVSNCLSQSSRNEMVGILQKYIQIDVYGACGNLTCSKRTDKSSESTEQCLNMVAKNYKFYLALENSLCRDYVTEKFFENMRRPILTVVFGLQDDHEKLAPQHSFINAAKFKNVKSLAEHLILLDGNDTMYNEYFWWKDHFQVHNSQRDKNRGMCHLCASLHNKTTPPKIYTNMTDWWEQQALCQTPKIV